MRTDSWLLTKSYGSDSIPTLEGWRPDVGKKDKDGNEVEDRIYNTKDFDKNLVIDERTKIVAKKISEYLRKTNRFDKTIVFVWILSTPSA